jgi:riboflavin synthase
MFTGIVEEMGEVLAVAGGAQAARLTVRGPGVCADLTRGASVAVDGCCLTVVARGADTFTADVMTETLSRTALGERRPGDPVNLERALPATGRLDGHLVQGHVDGTGQIAARTPGERTETLQISLPPAGARYIAAKGSIAVDGVSLTVVAAGADAFTVALIPETLARTTLGSKPVGAAVNLEFDVLAKYVERLLALGPAANHPKESTT